MGLLPHVGRAAGRADAVDTRAFVGFTPLEVDGHALVLPVGPNNKED